MILCKLTFPRSSLIQSLLTGTCATYIYTWITSVTHLHILFSSVPCYLQCNNDGTGKIEGKYEFGIVSFFFLLRLAIMPSINGVSGWKWHVVICLPLNDGGGMPCCFDSLLPWYPVYIWPWSCTLLFTNSSFMQTRAWKEWERETEYDNGILLDDNGFSLFIFTMKFAVTQHGISSAVELLHLLTVKSSMCLWCRCCKIQAYSWDLFCEGSQQFLD